MNKHEIEQALKEDIGIRKEIVALKPLKEIPEGIPSYGEMAIPGLCTMIGEILNEKKVFYSVKENHQC